MFHVCVLPRHRSRTLDQLCSDHLFFAPDVFGLNSYCRRSRLMHIYGSGRNVPACSVMLELLHPGTLVAPVLWWRRERLYDIDCAPSVAKRFLELLPVVFFHTL